MKFKAYTGITWSLLELTGLVEDADSLVHLERVKKHLGLHPFHLTNLQAALNEILSSNLNSYDAELKGFPLAYKNPKVITPLGEVFYDTCFIHVDVEADYYIFRPQLEKTLKGVVNKKGLNHIGVLVHKAFNVSIPSPEDVKDWLGDNIEIGEQVKFSITLLDYSSRLPFIRGALNEEEYLQRCTLPSKNETASDTEQIAATRIKSKSINKAKRLSGTNRYEDSDDTLNNDLNDPLKDNLKRSRKSSKDKPKKEACVTDEDSETTKRNKKGKKTKELCLPNTSGDESTQSDVKPLERISQSSISGYSEEQEDDEGLTPKRNIRKFNDSISPESTETISSKKRSKKSKGICPAVKSEDESSQNDEKPLEISHHNMSGYSEEQEDDEELTPKRNIRKFNDSIHPESTETISSKKRSKKSKGIYSVVKSEDESSQNDEKPLEIISQNNMSGYSEEQEDDEGLTPKRNITKFNDSSPSGSTEMISTEKRSKKIKSISIFESENESAQDDVKPLKRISQKSISEYSEDQENDAELTPKRNIAKFNDFAPPESTERVSSKKRSKKMKLSDSELDFVIERMKTEPETTTGSTSGKKDKLKKHIKKLQSDIDDSLQDSEEPENNSKKSKKQSPKSKSNSNLEEDYVEVKTEEIVYDGETSKITSTPKKRRSKSKYSAKVTDTSEDEEKPDVGVIEKEMTRSQETKMVFDYDDVTVKDEKPADSMKTVESDFSQKEIKPDPADDDNYEQANKSSKKSKKTARSYHDLSDAEDDYASVEIKSENNDNVADYVFQSPAKVSVSKRERKRNDDCGEGVSVPKYARKRKHTNEDLDFSNVRIKRESSIKREEPGSSDLEMNSVEEVQINSNSPKKQSKKHRTSIEN